MLERELYETNEANIQLEIANQQFAFNALARLNSLKENLGQMHVSSLGRDQHRATMMDICLHRISLSSADYSRFASQNECYVNNDLGYRLFLHEVLRTLRADGNIPRSVIEGHGYDELLRDETRDKTVPVRALATRQLMQMPPPKPSLPAFKRQRSTPNLKDSTLRNELKKRIGDDPYTDDDMNAHKADAMDDLADVLEDLAEAREDAGQGSVAQPDLNATMVSLSTEEDIDRAASAFDEELAAGEGEATRDATPSNASVHPEVATVVASQSGIATTTHVAQDESLDEPTVQTVPTRVATQPREPIKSVEIVDDSQIPKKVTTQPRQPANSVEIIDDPEIPKKSTSQKLTKDGQPQKKRGPKPGEKGPKHGGHLTAAAAKWRQIIQEFPEEFRKLCTLCGNLVADAKDSKYPRFQNWHYFMFHPTVNQMLRSNQKGCFNLAWRSFPMTDNNPDNLVPANIREQILAWLDQPASRLILNPTGAARTNRFYFDMFENVSRQYVLEGREVEPDFELVEIVKDQSNWWQQLRVDAAIRQQTDPDYQLPAVKKQTGRPKKNAGNAADEGEDEDF